MAGDVAHRLAGDPDQPAKRLIQLQDQEDRAGHRQGRHQQRGNRGAVRRPEQPEAEEEDREPEDHNDQQGRGDRGCRPARTAASASGRDRRRSPAPAISASAGRRSAAQASGWRRRALRRWRASGPTGLSWSLFSGQRRVIAPSSARRSTARASAASGPVKGQDAVQKGGLARHLNHRALLGVVRAFRGRHEQTQHQRRHGGDQAHGELHRVLGVRAQVMFRQGVAEPASPATRRQRRRQRR